jgi:hypothetical protein
VIESIELVAEEVVAGLVSPSVVTCDQLGPTKSSAGALGPGVVGQELA